MGGSRKLLASLGIAAPAGFISAWIAGGAITEGYSHVNDHISRLAASGVSTRPIVTAGFGWYALTATAFAALVRKELSTATAVAVVGSAVGSVGLAVFPLDVSARGDQLHAVAAGGTYVALTLTPLFGARALRKQGHRRASAGSYAVSAFAAASFAASLAGPAHGLFQRLGISSVDAWMIALALVLLRSSSNEPAAPKVVTKAGEAS